MHDRELATERADEAAERERVIRADPQRGGRVLRHPPRLDAGLRLGDAGRGRHEAEERRRRLLVVGGRAEHHDAGRTGDGEREHPQLVAEDLGALVDVGPVEAACDGGEALGVQQGSAQPQVRPHALLQGRDRDHLVSRAHDRGRRGDQHGVGERLRRERVLRHLGAEQLLHEVRRGTARAPFDEPPRGREERDHAVEVAVRLVGDDARLQRLLEPRLRQLRALPQMPEQLLDGAVGGCELAGPLQRAREPAEATRRREVERLEPAGRGERLDEQLVARAVPVARELLLPHREPEPTERDAVEPAEWTRGELRRDVRRERHSAEHDVDGPDEGERGEIVAEGAPGDGRARGHLGGREAAGDLGHEGSGAHQHDHARPRHAAQQVLLPEPPREAGELEGARRRLDDLDRVGVVVEARGGSRLPLPPRARRADARHDGRGERPERGRLPVHPVEHERAEAGQPEHGGEASERRCLRPAEGGRRDVRVAERDHVGTARGERPEEGQGRDGRLVQVVGDDQADPRQRFPPRHEQHGLGEELRAVEVVAAEGVDDVLVLAGERGRGDPLGHVVRTAELGEGVRPHALLGRAHEQLAELRAEGAETAHLDAERIRPRGPGAQLLVPGEEVGDDQVLLGAREQPGRLGAGLGGAAREHLEGDGRGGAGERPEGGNPHAERELVAQARGGRARRREHQHLGGIEALGEDPLGDELPQRRGATRARRPDDCCAHPDGQLHDGALRRVQLHLGDLSAGDGGWRLAESPDGHAPTLPAAPDGGRSPHRRPPRGRRERTPGRPGAGPSALSERRRAAHPGALA